MGALTQAEVSRAVRGAIAGHKAAGLSVGAVTTEISNGQIRVTVTTSEESVKPDRREALINGYAERIRAHAAGRP